MNRPTPTDIRYVTTESIRKKFVDAENRIREAYRTGAPYAQYMVEQEDDSRIRFPSSNWKDGIPTINQTWNGYSSGIACIAGRANCGKTTAMVTWMRGAIELNDDTIVVDCSLDDPPKKRLVQFMANISGVRYTDITLNPSLSSAKQALVDDARDRFFSWIDSGRLISLEPHEKIDEDRTIRTRDYKSLVFFMEHLRSQNPKAKIIFMVDAWNNLDMSQARGTSELTMANQMLEELKRASEENEVNLVVSAHFRKTTEKRPTIQDIKGTSDMEYNAVSCLIVRNEYRENSLTRPMVYEFEDGTEAPILTFEVPKTKVGDWDKTMLYILRSDICRIEPLHPAEYVENLEIYRGKRS